MACEWMIYALVGARVWVVAGPDHWPGTCASGSSQSPINIVPSTAESKDVEILALNGYDTAEGHGFTLGNNGHTGTIASLSFAARGATRSQLPHHKP